MKTDKTLVAAVIVDASPIQTARVTVVAVVQLGSRKRTRGANSVRTISTPPLICQEDDSYSIQRIRGFLK